MHNFFCLQKTQIYGFLLIGIEQPFGDEPAFIKAHHIQPTIVISNLREGSLFVELFVGRDAQIGRREARVTEMERLR